MNTPWKFFGRGVRYACVAFVCLSFGATNRFAQAREPGEIIRKQLDYRRSLMPLEFEADVTTTVAGRPTRRSRYYCRFDENCMVIVRLYLYDRAIGIHEG